jgi:hypothetical protein
MHKGIVRRGSMAALAPLFGMGLLHCTFSDLNALGAGPSDSSLPPELVTPSAEAAPDVASSDESDDDSSSPDASAAPEATSSLDDGATPDVDLSADVADGGDLDASGADVADATGDQGSAGSSVPGMAPPRWLDAGTLSWCGMQQSFVMHTFCADFDQASLPAGFSASDGQFLSETSSDAKSSPNDLLFYAAAQAAAGTFGSKLSRSFPTYSSSISLSFDVEPELVDSTSGLLFAALDFLGNGSAKYSIRLAYNMGIPRLEESFLGSPADIYHSNFTLPVQTWSRVEVDITFAGDAGTSTESIFVNGVPAGATEILEPTPGFDSRPNLLVGAVYGTSPAGAWAIRYDDVTLDIH